LDSAPEALTSIVNPLAPGHKFPCCRQIEIDGTIRRLDSLLTSQAKMNDVGASSRDLLASGRSGLKQCTDPV